MPESDVVAIGIFSGGLWGKTLPLATKAKWLHAMGTGVERMLTPETIAHPAPLTNAATSPPSNRSVMEQHEDILVRPHSLISDPLDRTNTLVQHATCLGDNAFQRPHSHIISVTSGGHFMPAKPEESRIYTHMDGLLGWTGCEQGTNARSTVERTHEKEQRLKPSYGYS